MLLSFSVPKMLPWIENGLRQYAGEDVTGRVKRQTIRATGPRYELLLRCAGDPVVLQVATLHLWWKSRTKERRSLGDVKNFRIRPITITREADEENDCDYMMVKIAGDDGPAALWMEWIPSKSITALHEWKGGIGKLIYDDGFDSFDDFAEFFVPNVGDVFKGVLLQW
jgi:hypothetical protein